MTFFRISVWKMSRENTPWNEENNVKMVQNQGEKSLFMITPPQWKFPHTSEICKTFLQEGPSLRIGKILHRDVVSFDFATNLHGHTVTQTGNN